MDTVFIALNGQQTPLIVETGSFGLAQKLLRQIEVSGVSAAQSAAIALAAQQASEQALATFEESIPTLAQRDATNVGDYASDWRAATGSAGVEGEGVNAAPFRTALELGDAALKDTGTTAGTLAAGDDSRIVGAAQKSSNLSDLTDADAAVENLGLNARVPLIPELFGAVAGTVVNNTEAIADLIAAASLTGLPVDLRGNTYLVSELSVPILSLHIDNGTIGEFAPNTGEPRTITLTSGGAGSYVVFGPRFKFDRRGNGTAGTVNGSWGLYCNGLSRVEWNGEGTGNGRGSWLLIDSATEVIDRGYLHDGRYAHTSETDDTVIGFNARRCENVYVRGRVIGFGRIDQTSASRDRFSRGYSFGGCRRVVWSGFVERVDQGVDFTGDLNSGNTHVTLSGGVAKNCATYGGKFANCVVAGSVNGFIVDQAGRAAVTISGPASNIKNKTRDVLVSGLVATNIGSNKLWSNPSVVLIEGAGGGLDPVGIRITGNKAVSFSGASTFTVYDSDEITLASYLSIATGVRVRLTTTGTLPTGLATATDYWLIDVPESNRVKLASSYINALDGVAISTLAGGSGTHTMTLQVDCAYGVDDQTTDRDGTAPNVEQGNDWSNLVPRSSTYSPYSATASRGDKSVATAEITRLDFSAKVDPFGMVTLSDGESRGVFTALRAGRYRFRIKGQWTGTATGERYVMIQNRPSGGAWADAPISVARLPAGSGTSLFAQEAYWEGWMNVGDALSCTLYQTSGSTLNYSLLGCEFGMIGAL